MPPTLPLIAAPPADPGERCGTWRLQVAPELARVRASIEDLARRSYAEPSPVAPERSLLGGLERLALTVSELGANALRHAEPPVTVSLARLPGGWLLDVSDGAPHAGPLVEPDGVDLGYRHGLQLVALVSTSVGWYADAEMKHVWAVVPDQTPLGLAERLR